MKWILADLIWIFVSVVGYNVFLVLKPTKNLFFLCKFITNVKTVTERTRHQPPSSSNSRDVLPRRSVLSPSHWTTRLASGISAFTSQGNVRDVPKKRGLFYSTVTGYSQRYKLAVFCINKVSVTAVQGTP